MVAFHWTITSFLLAAVALSEPIVQSRDSAAIIDDLNTINTDTSNLQSVLSNYEGGTFTALPIRTASQQLTQDIQNAVSSASYYGFSSDQESQQALSLIYYQLAPNVEATAVILTQKKQLFDDAGLSGQVLQSLQTLSQASSQYGQILASRNPDFAAANARIDAALGGALAAYSYSA